ncbi:hypothetical protein C4J95_4069 [Pseudomonas orientalis]|nr:hypothetical protein C4J95_4069 [Pseudomonas orientalis]
MSQYAEKGDPLYNWILNNKISPNSKKRKLAILNQLNIRHNKKAVKYQA